MKHSLPLAAGISLAIMYTVGTILYVALPLFAANLSSSWLGSMHTGTVDVMTFVKGLINTFVLTYIIVALTQYVNDLLHKHN